MGASAKAREKHSKKAEATAKTPAICPRIKDNFLK
jgi:hypothetical protein